MERGLLAPKRMRRFWELLHGGSHSHLLLASLRAANHLNVYTHTQWLSMCAQRLEWLPVADLLSQGSLSSFLFEGKNSVEKYRRFKQKFVLTKSSKADSPKREECRASEETIHSILHCDCKEIVLTICEIQKICTRQGNPPKSWRTDLPFRVFLSMIL